MEGLLALEIKPREILLDPIARTGPRALRYQERARLTDPRHRSSSCACSSFLRWHAPGHEQFCMLTEVLQRRWERIRRLSASSAAARIENRDSGPAGLADAGPGFRDRAAAPRPLWEDRSCDTGRLWRFVSPGTERRSRLANNQVDTQVAEAGISMLFVHHSGKNHVRAHQAEDLLDTVIALKHPADFDPSRGLRC